jgi:hypothetical protein
VFTLTSQLPNHFEGERREEVNKRQLTGAIIACVLLLSTLVLAQQDKRPLTNEDVVKMVKAGLPEDTIVLVIQKSPNRFDTSPEALIALKESGATKRVLDAVVQSQDSPTREIKVESSTNPGELKLGLYSAEATQTYLNSSLYSSIVRTTEVSIKIKIVSVDSDGNVTGEFFHSTLGGKGSLKGKIERDSDFKVYKLQLKGDLISKFGDTWQVAVQATLGDKALIKGQYQVKSGASLMTADFKKAELEEDK